MKSTKWERERKGAVSKCCLLLIAWMLMISPLAMLGSVGGDNNFEYISGVPSPQLNYVTHAPIRIDSNADFDAAHGVTGGNGSQGNPWIIEGWDINGTGYGNCIYIGNTTDYYVVRDCYLHDASGTGPVPYYQNTGLHLYNVQNGAITNNNASINKYGIYLYKSVNIVITNNNASNNERGVNIREASDNIIISNNIVSWNSAYGIYFYYSSNNTIINNTASWNGGSGIHFHWSSNHTTIYNNTASNNSNGIHLNDSNNNTIANNTVFWNTNTGIRLQGWCNNNNITDNIVANNDKGMTPGAAGTDSINFISNNIIFNNTYGIYHWASVNDLITNNTVSNNAYGIYLWGSESNTLTNNIISSNTDHGIYLTISNNNVIYHNNIINNTNQAYDTGSNYWDNGYPSGGNYWSDYNGTDDFSGMGQDVPGSDGIGDLPYNSTTGQGIKGGAGAQDNYPLMQPLGEESLIDWPMFHHNPYRSGAIRTKAPDTNELSWVFNTGGAVSSSPAVSNGKLFVGSWDRKMYALKEDTGELLWTYTTGGPVESSPCVANGKVFFGSNDGKVYTLSEGTGEFIWSYSTGGAVKSSPVVVNGTVFTGSYDKKVYALNESTGVEIWNYTTGGAIKTSSPTVANGRVFIGSDDKYYYALDAVTGAYLWKHGTCYMAKCTSPVYRDGEVIVVSDTGIEALKETDGSVIWDHVWGPSSPSTPAYANDNIYFSLQMHIVALDGVTHNELWEYWEDGEIMSSPAVADGKIFAGKGMVNGKFFALNETTGELLWEYGITVESSSPAVANGRVFVGAQNGNVYAFGKDVGPPLADAGPDHWVDEDTMVYFDGSGSTDNVGIVNYTWAFDDNGNPITLYGVNPSYIFVEPGTYVVTLNVSDAAGNWGTDNCTIYVKDITSPSADAGPDQWVNEDTIVYLDGSASTDNGRIVNYTWTFDDNDQPITLYDVNPSYVFVDPGTYNVTLNVTDGYGNWDTDNCTIYVDDVTSPNADAGPDQYVDEYTIVYLNGTGSSDNGEIVNYTWTFDDQGTTVNLFEAEVTYTFAQPGDYMITLIVFDAAGNWDTDACVIHVNDTTNPVADAGPDQWVDEDAIVYFDSSGSSDNVGIMNYTWSFYENGSLKKLSGANPSYIFVQPGIYLVTLNVTDVSGNWGTDNCIIYVNDTTNPVADAGPDQWVDEDTVIYLNGSGSSDNVGIVNYTWSFDDQGTAITLYGVEVSHIFEQPGEYVATLNVTDATGNWDTDTCIIHVGDVTAPTADAGPDQWVDEDTIVYFDGSGSTDNVGIVNYTWTFDEDGSVKKLFGANPSYIFVQPGIFLVTLNVTDAAGNWDTDDCTIYVNDTTNPIADAGPDQWVDEDTIVYLSGSGSTDNIEIVNYTWTFEDQDAAIQLYGVEVSYVFEQPGEYQAMLNVTDAAGNWDTDTCTIYVGDTTSPIADAGPDQWIELDNEGNITVYFDGSGSTDNVGIVNYTWMFDENGDLVTLYEVTPSYMLTQPGAYIVTLKVTDAAGNWDTDACTIYVDDTCPPVISDVIVAPPEPNNRAVITIVCKVTDNVDVASVTLTYLHNGTTWVTLPMVNDVSHIYRVNFGPVNQSFPYFINATDSSGNTATYSGNVTVKTAQIDATVEGLDSDQELDTGSTVQITGTVYVDGEANGTGFYIVAMFNGDEVGRCVMEEDGTYALEFVLPELGSDDNSLEIELVDSIGGEVQQLESMIIPGKQPFPWFMVMFASVIGASAALGLATEVGKYALLMVFLPLYSKIRKDKVLDQETRGMIRGYIMAYSGDHYNSIMKGLKLSNGTFAYHIRILEREEIIKSRTDGIYKRFYPMEKAIPNNGMGRLTNTQKRIFEKIEETPGISQKDIATLLGISASTVNYQINKMRGLNVIRRERRGMRVRYYEVPLSVGEVGADSSQLPSEAEVSLPELETIECPSCNMLVEVWMSSCPFCGKSIPTESQYLSPEKLKRQEILEKVEKAYKEGKLSESQYLKNREKFGG